MAKVKKTSQAKIIADAIDRQTQATVRREATRLSERRKEIGSGLVSFGNLSAAALIFGQAFGGFSFDVRTAFLGLYFLVSLYFFAFVLLKGGVSRD